MSDLWERRLRIVDELHYNRFVTYGMLAEKMDVSARTIRSDIADLCRIIPLNTMSGHFGGVCVPESWKRGDRYLTSEQEGLLVELMMLLPPEKQEIMQSIITTFAMPKIKEE